MTLDTIENKEVDIEGTRCEITINHQEGRVDLYVYLHDDGIAEHHYFGGEDPNLISEHEAIQYLYRVLT